MNTEPSTVRAIVREINQADALVEVEQGGCGRCHEAGGCGGQQLTRMFCSTAKTYRVANEIGARVGDRVTVAIAADSVRRSANLAYVLPLTATIAGADVGQGDEVAVLELCRETDAGHHRHQRPEHRYRRLPRRSPIRPTY